MPHPRGDVRSAPIVTGSEIDTYGTHYDYLGIGGFSAVRTIAELNAIPVNPATMGLNFGDDLSSGRRRVNMRRYVLSEDKTFVLHIPGYAALTTSQKYTALALNDNWKDANNVDFPLTATNTTFDNSNTNLVATNVQQAIEEVLNNPEQAVKATNRAGTFNADNGLVRLLGAGPEVALPAPEDSFNDFFVVTTAAVYGDLAYNLDDWIWSDGVVWRRAVNRNIVRRINGQYGDVLLTVETSLVLTIDTDGQTVFELPNNIADFGTSKLFVNGQKQRYGVDYTGLGNVLTWISTHFSLKAGRHYLEFLYY